MMTGDGSDDREFDVFLRDLGPEVPRPELGPHERQTLLAVLGGSPTRDQPASNERGRIVLWKLAAAAGVTLAAAIGVWGLVQSERLARAHKSLATSRWEVSEVASLLMSARQGQRTIYTPDSLEGVAPSDLLVMTFDHALCPIARACTPGFHELARRRSGEASGFLTLDVTGEHRERVERQIEEMGLGYALLAPLGAETGVVKVVDRRYGRVLSSAPGRQGLEQADALLARVSGRGAPPG